jgi:hypothetical protein
MGESKRKRGIRAQQGMGNRQLAAVCTNPDRGTGISRHTKGYFRGNQM